MPIHRAAVFSLVAFALAASSAAAQDASPVEVTPSVAFGSAGVAPLGTAVTFPVTPKLSVETDVAYRRGEGHINALSSSASLLYWLPRVHQTTPYIAGGIGLAQYGAPVFSSSGVSPIGTARRLAMTVNAGGGLKTPMSRKFAWRTDVRWSKSLGQRATEGSEQFRVAQGISFGAGRR
jgi:hypothetical protein